MYSRLLIVVPTLLASLSLAAPAFAQDAKPADPKAAGAKPVATTDAPKTDRVTLKNGDVVRGAIAGADATKLTFTQAGGDALVLSWGNIASLLSAGPQKVRLKDGSILNGMILEGTGDGKLQVSTASAGRMPEIDISNIDGFGDAPKPPDVVWSGNIVVGITVQDGNTREKSAFGSFDAARKSLDDLIEAHVHYKYTQVGRFVTSRNGNARMQYNYTIWDPTYLYVRGSFDYNRFSNLNLRTRVGGGLGLTILTGKPYAWRAEAGVEYVNEDLRNAKDERFAVARLATIVTWEPVEWFRFREFAEYFPNLEKGSDFTFHSETTASFDLWGGFGLGIAVIVDYDETPTKATKHRTDTTYTGTLTYKF